MAKRGIADNLSLYYPAKNTKNLLESTETLKKENLKGLRKKAKSKIADEEFVTLSQMKKRHYVQ